VKVHEQRDALAESIRVALPYLSGGPPLSAFGIARDDCALVHIDWFAGVDMAAMHLVNTLAEIRGVEPHVLYRELGRPERQCECRSCVGPERAAAAEARHRAAYEKVAAWVEQTPAERLHEKLVR
jgi:hypothetical protein